MISRKLPRLYLITDRHQTRQQPLLSALDQALTSGIRMVQIREKDLETRELVTLIEILLPLIHQHHGIALINDRVDMVLPLGADGVHLRSDSLPLPFARQQLGNDRLIGKSTHSVEDIRRAEEEGADFAVLGPIYQTPSKDQYGPPLGLSVLQEASSICRIPIYAIGGILPGRIPEILNAGGYGVAVISSILQAPSIPEITQEYISLLS